MRNVEVNRFAREITMQPWPGGGEHDAQENGANRQHNQRHRHHTRTLVRVFSSTAAIPKKDIDHLTRHIKRRENDAGHIR